MGILTDAYLDPKNKWILIREGIENGQKFTTSLAIPPTKGDRTDIIGDKDSKAGYLNSADVIVIIIKGGDVEEIYFNNKIPKMFSKQYMKFAKDSPIKNLTNSQHRFIEFLLKNHRIVGQIGSFIKLFEITRQWIKENRDEFYSDSR